MKFLAVLISGLLHTLACAKDNPCTDGEKLVEKRGTGFSDGSPCVFPFTVDGVTYNECAFSGDQSPYFGSAEQMFGKERKTYQGQASEYWCSTSKEYSATGSTKENWAYCYCSSKDALTANRNSLPTSNQSNSKTNLDDSTVLTTGVIVVIGLVAVGTLTVFGVAARSYEMRRKIETSRSPMPNVINQATLPDGNSHSWSRLKGWINYKTGKNDVTLAYASRTQLAVASENPIQKKEDEIRKVHHLSAPRRSRQKPRTLSSALEKQRFELDVPSYERKKSVGNNKVLIEKLKLEEKKEKEERRKILHKKKSSMNMRLEMDIELPNPKVCHDAYLNVGPGQVQDHAQDFTKALQNAELAVLASQKRLGGIELLEVDSEDESDNDEAAREYFRKKTLGPSDFSTKAAFGI